MRGTRGLAGIRSQVRNLAAQMRQKAEEIDAYLQIAKRAGVQGAAIFTWHTLQPYLSEVKQGNYLGKFQAGLKPAAW